MLFSFTFTFSSIVFCSETKGFFKQTDKKMNTNVSNLNVVLNQRVPANQQPTIIIKLIHYNQQINVKERKVTTRGRSSLDVLCHSSGPGY